MISLLGDMNFEFNDDTHLLMAKNPSSFERSTWKYPADHDIITLHVSNYFVEKCTVLITMQNKSRIIEVAKINQESQECNNNSLYLAVME